METNDVGLNRGAAGASGATGNEDLTAIYRPRREIKSKKPELFKPKPIDRFIKILSYLTIAAALAFAAYYGYGSYQTTKTSTPMAKIAPGLEEKVRKNPRDLQARLALANAYLNSGSYDAAIEQYSEAEKLNKKDQNAVTGLALAYMKKGENEKALEYFEKEINLAKKGNYNKINAKLESSYYYGGTLWFKQGHLDKAYEYFKQAAIINPSSSDTYMAMGRVLLEKKDYKNAALQFERALNFDPKFVDAQYGYGVALENLGRKEEALLHYRKAVELNPNFDMARQAVDRLKNANGGTQ